MKKITLSGNLSNKAVSTQLRVNRSLIIEIISALLIFLFMYTAISKILDYQNFRLQLGKSPFITRYAAVIAWLLPTIEIVVGLALALKRFRLIGLYLSLFLMTSFTAYIYVMLNYSYYIPCSCGGVLAMMNWDQHLWFNIFFVIISTVGIILKIKETNQKLRENERI